MRTKPPVADKGSQPSDSTPPAQAVAGEASHGASRVAHRRRTAAAIIAVAWPAALAVLVLTTANPVTLNRRQVLQADAVVTARILNPETGACRIVRQWSGDPLPDQSVVAKLSETAVRADEEWILPLASTPDGWEVLPSHLPSAARLVYPATPDAVRQLETILADKQGR